jgi:amino acid permease
MPFLSYGFLGIELISVTAYESREKGRELRHSARWIAIVITILFFLSGIGECLNFKWNDPGLPQLDTRQDSHTESSSQSASEAFSILVLAAKKTGHGRVASVANGILIFSCLSAANTASYVSSRVLYGLCRSDNISNRSEARQWTAKLAKLHPRTRVPMRAVILSWVAAGLLPVLQTNGTSATEVGSHLSRAIRFANQISSYQF